MNTILFYAACAATGLLFIITCFTAVYFNFFQSLRGLILDMRVRGKETEPEAGVSLPKARPGEIEGADGTTGLLTDEAFRSEGETDDDKTILLTDLQNEEKR